MQAGSLRKQFGGWHLRYYVTSIGPDGQPRRKQVTKMLARVSPDYRVPSDLRSLVIEELAKANHAGTRGDLTLAQFADDYWLPFVATRRRASTHKFYKDLFDNHLREAVGKLKLREFETFHAQQALDAIPLSQSSLQGIKVGMSALYSHALRKGFVKGVNPVHEARPEGKHTEFEGEAYTAKDVEFFLSKLTGVARVVVATAAYTGLRLAELRGLQWQDYDGKELYVRRSVWRRNVGDTKTKESKAKVPVVKTLRLILDEHKEASSGNTWIFQGDKKKFSLHLDNLCRREIRPVLGNHWRGWHAFRRGLATVLYGLDFDAEIAALILRHSDSAVTRKHYIKLEGQKEGAAAMRRLEQTLAKKGVKQGVKKGRK